MKPEKTYYVYMMANKYNGTIYVGVTNDLTRRVHEHKSGLFDGFTKKYDIRNLVWFDVTCSINDAIEVEKKIKNRGRQFKINLIEKSNPEWKDLNISL